MATNKSRLLSPSLPEGANRIGSTFLCSQIYVLNLRLRASGSDCALCFTSCHVQRSVKVQCCAMSNTNYERIGHNR
jgi:hypothetical protein